MKAWLIGALFFVGIAAITEIINRYFGGIMLALSVAFVFCFASGVFYLVGRLIMEGMNWQ